MSSSEDIVSKAAQARAAKVFNSVTGRIEQALGADWLPGTGQQILEEVRVFCRENLPELGQRQFALKIKCQESINTGTPLSPRLIADLRREHTGVPLIEVGGGLQVLSSSLLQIPLGDDLRNAVTDASIDCAIFLYENDRLCSIWAKCQRIKEVIPSDWSSVGLAGNRSWDASEYNEATKEHYRRMVKYGQNLNHWQDEDKRILKKADPPKCPTTESMFHASLTWWLQEHLPPHSVVISDGTKGVGDVPDIIILGFNCFYVLEIKWLGANGSTSYTWAAIRHAMRQGSRYSTRSPHPEALSVAIYDARKESDFAAFKENLSEEGIVTFNEFEGESLPVNGSCHIFYLYSGTASQNAKKK